jgi:hypothetical protein
MEAINKMSGPFNSMADAIEKTYSPFRRFLLQLSSMRFIFGIVGFAIGSLVSVGSDLVKFFSGGRQETEDFNKAMSRAIVLFRLVNDDALLASNIMHRLANILGKEAFIALSNNTDIMELLVRQSPDLIEKIAQLARKFEDKGLTTADKAFGAILQALLGLDRGPLEDIIGNFDALGIVGASLDAQNIPGTLAAINDILNNTTSAFTGAREELEKLIEKIQSLIPIGSTIKGNPFGGIYWAVKDIDEAFAAGEISVGEYEAKIKEMTKNALLALDQLGYKFGGDTGQEDSLKKKIDQTIASLEPILSLLDFISKKVAEINAQLPFNLPGAGPQPLPPQTPGTGYNPGGGEYQETPGGNIPPPYTLPGYQPFEGYSPDIGGQTQININIGDEPIARLLYDFTNKELSKLETL